MVYACKERCEKEPVLEFPTGAKCDHNNGEFEVRCACTEIFWRIIGWESEGKVVGSVDKNCPDRGYSDCAEYTDQVCTRTAETGRRREIPIECTICAEEIPTGTHRSPDQDK